MNQTLKGIRILDLTHMLAGPYGSMILADLGAETIKVEPLKGEGTRKLLANDPSNSLEGMGAYYITLNRNKKSVAIDLKTEKGLRVFYRLIEKSDIVINNFGAGVPERLKIDYLTLKKINSRIITCSISGFVQTALVVEGLLLIKLLRLWVAACLLPALIGSNQFEPESPLVTLVAVCSA